MADRRPAQGVRKGTLIGTDGNPPETVVSGRFRLLV